MNFSDFGLWHILNITAIVSLVIFYKGRNAVWGGATGGAIIGVIVALVYWFKGDGFTWTTVGKGLVLGAAFGLGAELLGIIGTILKRKKS